MSGQGDQAKGRHDTGRMPVAFISHHSSEEKTARHLKEVLERNGIFGWMAPDDIEPGRPFDEAIVDQVEKSDLIVLLFCEKSDQSRHVKRELIMADNHKKLVYPIRLEDIAAKGLAYWLNDYQWIDWIDRRDETIQSLVETIKRQVAAKAEAEGTVPPPADDEPADLTALPPEAASPSSSASDTPAPPVVPPADTPGAAAAPETAPVTPAAPAGLMAQPASDGDGGSSGFSLRSMKPVHWLGVGAIAVIIIVIILLAVGGSGGDEEAEAAIELEPGQWQTRFEFVDAQFPDLPDNQASAIRTQVGNTIGNQPETATACVSPGAAANPNAGNILPEELVSWCDFSRDEIADGDVALRGTCMIPDTNGESEMEMTGDYDAESFDSRITFRFTDPNLGNWELIATYEAERTGDCG